MWINVFAILEHDGDFFTSHSQQLQQLELLADSTGEVATFDIPFTYPKITVHVHLEPWNQYAKVIEDGEDIVVKGEAAGAEPYVVISKAAGFLPYSQELIDDLPPDPSTMTPEERAEYERVRGLEREEHESLRAAGLLNDEGYQIGPLECPACWTIADGTGAGWNGPLGDYLQCERPRGHAGDHMFKALWTDAERSIAKEEAGAQL